MKSPSITRTIQSAHAASGLPAPPAWAGYWTFTTGVILVMFVLFVAQKNTLSQWIAFLTPPTSVPAWLSGNGSPVGSVLGVPGVTTLSPGATGILNSNGQEVLNPGAPFNLGTAVKSLLGGGVLMPLALIVIAWILIVTGIKGNYTALGQQFSSDVLSSGGFFNFLAGIVGIAVFFRLIGLPRVGEAFLILAIVAYLLENTNALTAVEDGLVAPASSSVAPAATTAGSAATPSAAGPATGAGAAAATGTPG